MATAGLNLSDQDFADLQEIKQRLPEGDPRHAKLDILFKSYQPDTSTAAKPNVNMQTDASVPTGYNTDAGGKLKGLPEMNPHTPTPEEAASDVGLAGSAMFAPTLVGRAAKMAAGMAIPTAASYAISEAKNLPVIGPVLKHIPFVEALPWLVYGGNKLKPAAAAAEGEAVAAKNAADPNNMREWWASRKGGLADQPIDRRAMQTRPEIKGGEITPPRSGPAPPAPGIEMRQKLNLEPTSTPEPVASGEPQVKKQGFGKGGFGSTAKPIGGPKRPAKFVEGGTPAVQAGPPKFGDVQTEVPQSSEDSMNLLQKMLGAVKKGKATPSTQPTANTIMSDSLERDSALNQAEYAGKVAKGRAMKAHAAKMKALKQSMAAD